MNRRKALAAFLGLPIGATLRRETAQSSDVGIIDCKNTPTDEEIDLMTEQWQKVFPGIKLLILDGNTTLRFVSQRKT